MLIVDIFTKYTKLPNNKTKLVDAEGPIINYYTPLQRSGGLDIVFVLCLSVSVFCVRPVKVLGARFV